METFQSTGTQKGTPLTNFDLDGVGVTILREGSEVEAELKFGPSTTSVLLREDGCTESINGIDIEVKGGIASFTGQNGTRLDFPLVKLLS